MLLLVVLHARAPVRVTSGAPGPLTPGIGAFVDTSAGPVAAAAPAPAVKKPKPAAPAHQTSAPSDTDTSEGHAQNSQGPASAAAGAAEGAGGPVRVGSGSVTLIKQVKPTYPRVLQSAGLQGTVVLEAIIHRDGTIGDIKVLSTTAAPFAESAVEAVRQWRYAPLPYEGLVTVTVNFTLR